MRLPLYLLLLGSCHPASRPAATGDSLYIKKGATFEITLSVNLGSGYSWSLADSAFSSLLRGDTQFVRTNVRDIDNGPEEQVFRFTALAAGKTRLSFRLARPWKKEEPPLQKKEYDITVN